MTDVLPRFLKDVEHHAMTVDLDTPPHRSLWFCAESTSISWFRLVTYPGGLLITGDMGTFVFERVQDMFTFFRRDGLIVNPDYWLQKLAGNPSHTEFDSDQFRALVMDRLDDWCRGESLPDVRRQQIVDELNELLAAPDAQEAHRLAAAFECNGFELSDFWEHDLTKPTFRVLWCLYAIVWGIQQYDLAAEAAVKTEAAP